jgi:serine/threonine protein kinase
MRDLIGRTLGHYRIVEKIGEGGMGEVYRAHDERLDRNVAVKVLAERVATSEDRVARFEREAKAIAKLSHPNILAIHDFGTEDETVYAVTELLEGESLRQVLSREWPLPVNKALSVARAAAAGLAVAHAKGIIHRDIKPGNIFVTEDGVVKILDFGLARSESETMIETVAPEEAGLGLTTPGVILGTLGYMSPEQARGRPASPASDVFSLGCVLYEMLTGVGPFRRGTQTDTLSAVLTEDPPPLDIAEEHVLRELGNGCRVRTGVGRGRRADGSTAAGCAVAGEAPEETEGLGPYTHRSHRCWFSAGTLAAASVKGAMGKRDGHPRDHAPCRNRGLSRCFQSGQ